MEDGLKHIRIRKEKEDKKEMRVIKVSRIKPETIQSQMRIRILRFKKEYEEFMKISGTSPDAFVNNTVNQIAAIYFKYKNGYNVNKVKEELEQTKYREFMNIFYNTSYKKLEALNVIQKMLNGAAILYNLLSSLISKEDLKIKTDIDIKEFELEYSQKKFLHYGFEKKPLTDYEVNYSLNRMYAIKQDKIIAVGNEINKNKNLKGSNILIEYDYRKRFLSVPYRYYKKLINIEKFELDGILLIDCSHSYFYDELDDLTEKELDDLEDKGEAMFFHYSLEALDLVEMIKRIMFFESFIDSLSEYDMMTEEGISIQRINIHLVKKDGTGELLTYEDFIRKYFYFLRL